MSIVSHLTAAVVTNTNDSGPGSLRDVIATASANDTITFDSSLDGQTIVLTNGQLNITNNLTIDASALSNRITITGNSNSPVLGFSYGTTNELKSLTITGGQGGIFSSGTLVLDTCIVRGNRTGDGGGIFNDFGAALSVNNSTISGNSASSVGGGIQTRYLLSISNSTVSGNSAGSDGGGISVATFGDVTIVNSTISGNVAKNSGGGMVLFGKANIKYSTISGNHATNSGGGVWIAPAMSASLSIENSIIAGNSAPVAPNISGTISNASGSNLTNGSPALAPLGDYGGFTLTMPPLPGSPVIDAATTTPDTPVTDQRGAMRPGGPLPDIGAVEAVAFSKLGLEDGDSDGIADILEGFDGPYPQFTVGTDDSGLDTDGDGSPDWEELFNMTALDNPVDNFRILSMSRALGFNAETNPVVEVTLRTFPDLAYELEAGSTLTGFQTITNSQITSTNHTETIQVSLPTGQGRAFVRAKRD